MRKKFIKMHGIGNDYIYFDCFSRPLPDPSRLAARLSDRHFSVGGDGVILIGKSSVADAKMRIFNADGSEGKMCGNGIRCVGKYLFDSGKVTRREMTVETLSGVRRLKVFSGADGKVSSVRVGMGKADFACFSVPVKTAEKYCIGREISVGGRVYKATCLSVGNPHCVIFSPPPEPFEEAGAAFETCGLFPEGVNVEFAERREDKFFVRVYERGSGETLACGTGACAVVAAAVKNGLCSEGEEIPVVLSGGTLFVRYTQEEIFMTGEAALSFVGTVEI